MRPLPHSMWWLALLIKGGNYSIPYMIWTVLFVHNCVGLAKLVVLGFG